MTSSDNMPAPLSAAEITDCCSAAGHSIDVRVLESVGSTNTWLLEGAFSAPVTLCAAEHQTIGRGRRGKVWHSPNSGVTFSMRFELEEPIERFNGLSLLVGAVLCDCLREIGVTDSWVKWPNDVLSGNAKLAGILIESRVLGKQTCIVVGMGINYKRGVEAGLVDQATTDLFEVLGCKQLPDRSQLIADIACRLVDVVSADIQQSISSLAGRWSEYDALAGTEVVATVSEESFAGIADGIDTGGGFRIRTADGLRVLTSANVSVRRT